MDEREVRPGWLPPKAPAILHAPRPSMPARPTFVTKPKTAAADGPSSPLAVVAISLSVISIVMIVLTIGVGWGICSLVSLMALALSLSARQRLRAGQPGRESQIRTAIVFSIVGLVLSAIAAAVWLGLQSNGITPQDLQDWLERELERRRGKA